MRQHITSLRSTFQSVNKQQKLPQVSQIYQIAMFIVIGDRYRGISPSPDHTPY